MASTDDVAGVMVIGLMEWNEKINREASEVHRSIDIVPCLAVKGQYCKENRKEPHDWNFEEVLSGTSGMDFVV